MNKILAVTFLSFGTIATVSITNSIKPVHAQAVSQQIVTEQAFDDVTYGDDHYMAIKFLKDQNIIQGYEDGSFKPDQQVNRAEALKIILEGIPRTLSKSVAATKTFDDVASDAWYAQYVEKALNNNIIAGYPDGLFHPEQTINKVESLKMVLLQSNTQLPVTVNEPPYADAPVDEWFAPYAEVSKEIGLFLPSRSGGKLSPADRVNRGDFAELMYRLLQSRQGYQFGRATFYSDELAGRGTSSGDPYNPGVFTTAHKTLPFGTMLRVTNLANGKSVDVKVNDRGPYATGVELDLSKSAFSAIAKTSTGIIVTQFKILSIPS